MQLPSFPSSFDDEFPAAPDGQRGYVGLDVLRGLITGIDEALEAHRQERSARKLGPVLIGVSPWLTDAEAEKMGGRQVARRGRRPKSAQT